jgi:hypothetical protein
MHPSLHNITGEISENEENVIDMGEVRNAYTF